MFVSPILQIERLILFAKTEKENTEEKQKPNDKEFEALLLIANKEVVRPRRSIRINESHDILDAAASLINYLLY